MVTSIIISELWSGWSLPSRNWKIPTSDLLLMPLCIFLSSVTTSCILSRCTSLFSPCWCWKQLTLTIVHRWNNKSEQQRELVHHMQAFHLLDNTGGQNVGDTAGPPIKLCLHVRRFNWSYCTPWYQAKSTEYMQSNLMKTHMDFGMDSHMLCEFMCKLIQFSILSHYSQAKSKSHPINNTPCKCTTAPLLW